MVEKSSLPNPLRFACSEQLVKLDRLLLSLPFIVLCCFQFRVSELFATSRQTLTILHFHIDDLAFVSSNTFLFALVPFGPYAGMPI